MRGKKILGLTVLLSLTLFITACKSKKCGCDSEPIFDVENEVGYIYGIGDENYAYIEASSIQGRFELCNTKDLPPSIKDNLDQSTGIHVIFSGEAMDDCIKLYYSWYYYYYNLDLTFIEKID